MARVTPGDDDDALLAALTNIPATLDHVPLFGWAGRWSSLAKSWYSSTKWIGGWTIPFLKSAGTEFY